ncbi:8735_t:CDS:2 [Entrophospora sp. SA101]|nr:8735_t:CDS:2 [Entrophospora sp. SA101]
MVPGSVQSLSDLFYKAIKLGQKQILCCESITTPIPLSISQVSDSSDVKAKVSIPTVFHPEKVLLETVVSVLVNNNISPKTKIPSTPQVSIQTHDRAYFRNKTLEQYSNFYREFSSENADYYGITAETLCPLCNLDHDDEESIEGKYKDGSYYIKCEKHETKITA